MKLAPLIYKTFEQENKQWVPKNHNPSSASFQYANGNVIGKDLLTLYLKWTGVPPSNPSNGQSLLKMDLGNSAHDTIAKVLAKAGIKAKSEVKGEMKLPELKNKVSYRVDGLHELNGQLEVLEVKSSTDQQMLSKGWGIIDTGPKSDHLLQIICYLNMEPGVRAGRLLYVSRDTGELIEYEISRNDNDTYLLNGKLIPELSWAGIIKRWVKLEDHLAKQVPPEPEFRPWLNDSGEVMKVKTINKVTYKTPWQVSYCPYKDFIWKNPDNYKYSQNAMFEAKANK